MATCICSFQDWLRKALDAVGLGRKGPGSKPKWQRASGLTEGPVVSKR